MTRTVLHLTRADVDALGPGATLDALAAHDTAILWGETRPASAADVHDLDLRGEVCPFTFVRTKLRLEEMRPGERLRVIVDHEPASRNIPRSAREWGQTIVHVGPIGAGVWQILIERKP
jgi:tRNA 2-thiouridine synthesizing protein A